MVYESLNHFRGIAAIKLSTDGFYKAKSARSSNISLLFLITQLVGYEMIIVLERISR